MPFKVFLLFILILYSFSLGKDSFPVCYILEQCKIKTKFNFCSNNFKLTDNTPLDNLKQRCIIFRRILTEPKVSPKSEVFKEAIYAISNPDQINYRDSNNISISINKFKYLLSDLEFTAKIINAFNKNTRYQITYLNSSKTEFKGSNHKNLTGTATLIAGDIHSNQLIFFGFGSIQFLTTKFLGQLIFNISYQQKSTKQITYEINVFIQASNSIFNKIMNLNIFHYFISTRIQKIIDKIHIAANGINLNSLILIKEKYNWSDSDLIKLEQLSKIE